MDQLLSGSLFVFLGLLLRTGLLLLFELVAARHLGPDSYGAFSLALTVVLVTAHMPAVGLQGSLRRFISYHLAREEPHEVRGLVTFGLVWPASLGLLLGMLLMIGSEPLATRAFGNPELAPLIRALALIVPFWSTRRLATMIFSGYQKPFFKIAVEDFLEPALRVVAALLIAVAGWGALQLGYGTLVVYLVVGVVAWFLVLRGRRELVGTGGGSRVPWQELLTFSGPLVVTELVDIVLAWVSILLLGALSAEYEVGLFRSASQPPMLASAILASFAFIYLPAATQLFASRNHTGWSEANNAVALWSLSLAFPAGTVCLLYPTELLDLLFGEEFRAGVAAMQVLGVAYLLHAACGFTGMNLLIAGYTKLQMAGALLALAVNVVFSLLWIPEHGAAGAAGAVLTSVVLRNGFNLAFMARLLQLFPFTRTYLSVLGIHLTSVGALVAGAYFLELPGLLGLLVVGLLELPLAACIGLMAGVLRISEVRSIASLLRARGARDAD